MSTRCFSAATLHSPLPAVGTLEDRTGWKIPGAPGRVEEAGDFDLVVVGGGYGGLGAAISAARMGRKVALIQNREVLGGNGSSEIRVWAKGNLPPSDYPWPISSARSRTRRKASPAPAGGICG